MGEAPEDIGNFWQSAAPRHSKVRVGGGKTQDFFQQKEGNDHNKKRTHPKRLQGKGTKTENITKLAKVMLDFFLRNF